jgi:hypothetical protein
MIVVETVVDQLLNPDLSLALIFLMPVIRANAVLSRFLAKSAYLFYFQQVLLSLDYKIVFTEGISMSLMTSLGLTV